MTSSSSPGGDDPLDLHAGHHCGDSCDLIKTAGAATPESTAHAISMAERDLRPSGSDGPHESGLDEEEMNDFSGLTSRWENSDSEESGESVTSKAVTKIIEAPNLEDEYEAARRITMRIRRMLHVRGGRGGRGQD